MIDDPIKALGVDLDEVLRSRFIVSLNVPVSIDRIEDGIYAELPDAGVSLVATDDQRVAAIHFYAEGYQGYRGYRGELPGRIAFGDSRCSIRSLLGTPAASGGGGVTLLGRSASWDRFDRTGYSVHVEFEEGERSSKLITIMRQDFVPR